MRDEECEQNSGMFDAGLLNRLPEVSYLVVPTNGDPDVALTADNIFVIEAIVRGSETNEARKPVPMLEWVRDLAAFSYPKRRFFESRVKATGDTLGNLIIRGLGRIHG